MFQTISTILKFQFLGIWIPAAIASNEDFSATKSFQQFGFKILSQKSVSKQDYEMQKALVIHNLGSQKQKTFDATSLFTISLKIFALVSSVNSAALQRSDPSPNECSLVGSGLNPTHGRL